MAGAAMNPNHPPSTAAMAYPGNPSLGMNVTKLTSIIAKILSPKLN